MYKIFKIVVFFVFCTISSYSQTLEETRTLFQNENYESALPALKKFATQQPANATISYMYGTSLFKTGNIHESIKYLEAAYRKKIIDAAYPLAQVYEQLYCFDKAVPYYTSYRTSLLQKKKSTSEVDKLLARCRNGLNMLLGVEKLCVVDSFVVDKAHFLEAYKIGPECGHLSLYKDFFQSAEAYNTVVYRTQLGNRIIYGKTNSFERLNLVSSNKTPDGWSEPLSLPSNINNPSANTNYPFLMSDGVTIYYASDGKGSMGGYDIFVTRYDTNTDSYLNPENVGMPINSASDDYMLVIDEVNNLGWFASDRYQPSDKVCIYVFIPNSSKQTYDNKSMTTNKLISLAQLRSIQSTWSDSTAVQDAQRRITDAVDQSAAANTKKAEFNFIVDDSHTYIYFDDFKSQAALSEFKNLLQLQAQYANDIEKLSSLRNQYRNADMSDRKALKPSILKMEKETLQNEVIIQNQTKKIRNLEIKQLNKQ
jgi:hypothetical protein